MSRQLALAPRDEHPPRWALVLLALALLVSVGLLFRWLNVQDETDRVAGNPAQFHRPAQAPEPPPAVEQPSRVERPAEEQQPEAVLLEVTSLAQLLEAPVKEELAARQVALEDVPVQEVVGNYTFWIGPTAEARVPVVLFGELTGRQHERRVEVREGQRLRIFGVVRRLRDVDTIEEARFLSAREREELRQEEIFISAWRVVVLEP